MSTTPLAAALYQLQQMDLDLERLVAEQQSIVNSLQGNVTLQKIRAEHTIAQQQLRSGLQTQKDAEWALEDLNRRLSVIDQRLYSGNVSNPKDLATLQKEAQQLRAQQSRQEEIVLEVIEAAEALQELVNRKAEKIQKAEADWKQERTQLELRRDQLGEKKQELQARRTQLSTTLATDLLSRYETLRRSKQGRAISKVEQGSCQWCRVILTPSELQHVRMSSDLQTCSNCGRILYYDR